MAWLCQRHLMLVFSVIALSLASFAVQAKSLTVSADRQTVEFGDIITLNIVADFQNNLAQLDLSSLEDQFEILGSQRSNQIQMVNGDFETSTRWLIQLLPKQVGELMIPPFKLGDVSSAPYPVTVKPLQKSLQGDLEPFFLQSEVNIAKPYIQQQVIYTLRFYHQGRTISGNIRPPQFGSAQTELLKDGEAFSKQINGIPYTVYEWIYAVYPQASGTLTISAPSFQGRLQYRGRLKQVEVKAKALELNVQAEPSAFKNQATNPWLPAANIEVTQQWQLPDGDIHVGDTLTQTVTLRAQGLMANQLPDLRLSESGDYKIYADQPVTSQQKTASGIHSEKQFKRALIPSRSGEVTIPQQTVYWWNTQTDRLEKSVLPGKTLTVRPAVGNDQPHQTMQAHDLRTPDAQPQATQDASERLWQGFTALFALLWLFTLGVWWKTRRQLAKGVSQQTSQASAKTAKTAEETEQAWSVNASLDTLCQLPLAQLYPALLNWLKQHHQLNHLAELADPALKQILFKLEACRYHQADFSETDRKRLCANLKAFDHKSQTEQAASKLKPLYPTHL
ncbi:BatD family protein [Thiomicrorhabdus sp. zzn3]|uniref:BatD family protein n=1 Tax=Thiomicrorhabdus sp. zzn3 TaxID=3039775 RepID=UPI0024369EFD|nr:BatD family protein [Thiomicrorhabdus sp. zzn3]MDG6778792.1 BatD family protein [Thiomicrorhabdus sp. zzn3]